MNTDRIDHLYQDPHDPEARLFLHYGDLTDSMNITRIIQETQPDEIYNLGAMSHVKVSFETPEYTANADGIGALRILEAIRLLKLEKKTRFYQASTSELYGMVQEVPQTETTPFYPRSPYGVAKLYAYWITVNYREAYGLYACNGILFNHESQLRGETFLSRKVSQAVARIALGHQEKLYVGNLDAQRDWGHAKDYVEAMWLMMQQDKAEDFVIATGKTTKVRDFIQVAFSEVGMRIQWEGNGEQEVGVLKEIDQSIFESVTGTKLDSSTVKEFVHNTIIQIDPSYFRPTEVDLLIGNPAKAKAKLGWEPKSGLDELIKEMVAQDLKKEGNLKDRPAN